MKREMLAVAILGALTIVAVNYSLARLGEPRNAWLFCNVLKACG